MSSSDTGSGCDAFGIALLENELQKCGVPIVEANKMIVVVRFGIKWTAINKEKNQGYWNTLICGATDGTLSPREEGEAIRRLSVKKAQHKDMLSSALR